MYKLTDIPNCQSAMGRGIAAFFATLMLVLAGFALPANAQSATDAPVAGAAAPAGAAGEATPADTEAVAAEADKAVEAILADDRVGGNEYPSLFFTKEERLAIEIALEKSGVVVDLQTIGRILGDEDDICLTCALEDEVEGEDTGPKVPTGPREIELAGVLYFSPYDWTIWLNGERVTPYFIPEEVIKLDVTRNNVYIEWFDRFYDRILRVNLRPHQTFYMDANVILSNQPSP